jgi:hypothetical protein
MPCPDRTLHSYEMAVHDGKVSASLINVKGAADQLKRAIEVWYSRLDGVESAGRAPVEPDRCQRSVRVWARVWSSPARSAAAIWGSLH